MTPHDVLQSARFLSRSPAFLSIQSETENPRLQPNEQYVTLRGFEDLKTKAREQAGLAAAATLPSVLATGTSDLGLTAGLESSESAAVRECWQKALKRLPHDPEGAITAARSLLEAGCKYVLEEFNTKPVLHMELPKLYKAAAALLKLGPRADVDQSLRQVAGAGATMVDGLARIRNQMSDAHGNGRHSPKPARRHAEFVVMMAGAMTGFLLATLDAQRTP